MGIVKISDHLHDQIRLSSAALGRSINAQAEHWLRVGQLAEHHPHLDYAGICALLLQQAAQAAGAAQQPGAKLAPAKGLQ
ncbi:ParD-like family protein [Delftia sp. PS-11]|uniref:ParD-like family protein n=1 Tax=Delftia sp. PS-11 TaxID=2767222 RepID=UPI0024587626|nr:ParD-like family protein [Delftia sp. PS-11]KAJ8745074.1 ParD-like family protein [Delftia sp. PS-11]